MKEYFQWLYLRFSFKSLCQVCMGWLDRHKLRLWSSFLNPRFILFTIMWRPIRTSVMHAIKNEWSEDLLWKNSETSVPSNQLCICLRLCCSSSTWKAKGINFIWMHVHRLLLDWSHSLEFVYNIKSKRWVSLGDLRMPIIYCYPVQLGVLMIVEPYDLHSCWFLSLLLYS